MSRTAVFYPLMLGIWLAACGGGGSGGSSGGSSSNRAPVITSAASVSVQENIAAAVYTATATDADGDTIAFSLSGADAARFTLNATTGVVTFVVPPDFENPSDADRDNVYALIVAASAAGQSASRAVTVTVTNRTGTVGARRVATGFATPIYLTGRGDGSGRVLVVQKGGLVRVMDPATGIVETTPFLDVSSQIASDGERGLLSMALAPDFATSGNLYAFMTSTTGAVQVRRFTATASGVPAGTAGDIILSIPHPRNNHLGGWLGFDAAGNLVLGTGDGGGGGDPDGNGQNRNTLLGKMLRIDPRSDAFPGDPDRDYAIPLGNPFAVSGGAPEIWHLGLRNPFRASFDATTDFLYIGDVGQGAWEEIDLARPVDGPLNFGWNIREGNHDYAGGPAIGLTEPVAEYAHSTGAFQGASIIGGYVYRGPLSALRGEYVFGDYISRRIGSIAANTLTQGVTLGSSAFTDRTTAFTPTTGAIGSILSFGEDDVRNLYILDAGGNVYQVTEVGE